MWSCSNKQLLYQNQEIKVNINLFSSFKILTDHAYSALNSDISFAFNHKRIKSKLNLNFAIISICKSQTNRSLRKSK